MLCKHNVLNLKVKLNIAFAQHHNIPEYDCDDSYGPSERQSFDVQSKYKIDVSALSASKRDNQCRSLMHNYHRL